jgi:hypothetical protein
MRSGVLPAHEELVANSEIVTIQVGQVPENSVCQYAGLRENEFATSILIAQK